MSMYDTIHFTCLNCKKPTKSQTKLNKNRLYNLIIGCDFDFHNSNIRMKDPCHNCKNYNTTIIRNKRRKDKMTITKRNIPFYSRKYRRFFKTYNSYGRYNKVQLQKWAYNKHKTHNNKVYRNEFWERID